MKKTIALTFLLFCFTKTLFSQVKKIKKEVYKDNIVALELGGHGFAYSLNYERIFVNEKKYKFSAQFGFAGYPNVLGFEKIWIPMVLNGIFPFAKNHHLDVGFGLMYWSGSTRSRFSTSPFNWKDKFTFESVFRLGYRHQNPQKRMVYKVAYTPFFFLSENEYQHWAGVSVGYRF
jgi:hypothetical protein